MSLFFILHFQGSLLTMPQEPINYLDIFSIFGGLYVVKGFLLISWLQVRVLYGS